MDFCHSSHSICRGISDNKALKRLMGMMIVIVGSWSHVCVINIVSFLPTLVGHLFTGTDNVN
jgi:hypothetical protein